MRFRPSLLICALSLSPAAFSRAVPADAQIVIGYPPPSPPRPISNTTASPAIVAAIIPPIGSYHVGLLRSSAGR